MIEHTPQHTPRDAGLKVRDAEWSPAHVEQSLVKLHEVRRRRTGNRRALAVCAGGLLCAAAALFSFVVPRGGTDGVKERGAPLAALDSKPLLLVGEKQQVEGVQTVRFSDGSTAELLEQGSQLLVAEVSAKRVSVELTEGSGRFDIVPDPQRRFMVQARGVAITVLGTQFTVDHEASRVRVAVGRGKVSVSSDLGERILTAGEAAWFQSEASTSESEHVPGGDLNAHVIEGKTVPAAPQASAAGIRAKFVEHSKRAEYKEAYALMAQAPSAVGSGDEDLMRAADAARYSGHPEEALTYLNKVKGGGEHATAAAFTRGRLYFHELGNPGLAAVAFAEARRLAPEGPLAEDAFFREIEARRRAGQKDQVRALANSYLMTYPKSRRFDAVARMRDNP